jgi:hypothetical protein
MPAKHKPRPAQRVPLPRYAVAIKAHRVADRWDIPAHKITVSAIDEADACAFAVQLAHAEVHIAPWKPYRRESLAFTGAKAIS